MARLPETLCKPGTQCEVLSANLKILDTFQNY